MKVQKYEIARVIDKLKSIVQKNDQFPALGGILVKDGYLIASNSEITMKVKLEASEGSYFIIPMKAFDLIKNLPDGEIDISATDKNVVMIKIGAIKNKYQSYPPEEFNFDITEDPEADGVELNGKKIMEATEEKQPAVFQIEDDVLNISIRDKLADYQEQVPLQETVCKSIRLGFDSRLVLETLKAFTCDNIALGFTSPRTPMIVEAEDSDMKAMVLPVAIREA